MLLRINRSLFLILLLLTTLLDGCTPRVSYVKKYGTAYNSERAKRGIPVIPTTWRVSDMGSFLDFSEPKPDMTKPLRLMKRIFIDKTGNDFLEIDTFYSGKSFKFPPKEIQVHQEISIKYDYSLEKTGNPWKISATLWPDQ